MRTLSKSVICILGAAPLVWVASCAAPLGRMLSSDCDRLIATEEQELLVSFDPEDSLVLGRDLEASRTYWQTDQTYELVRTLADEIGPWLGIARLEIGSAPGGPGYSSVWFVETNDRILELATGPGLLAPKQRMIPREEWLRFTDYLEAYSADELRSRASPYTADLPVYYFCAILDEHEFAFILYKISDDAPQFDIVARTLGLSQFKTVPLELQGRGGR